MNDTLKYAVGAFKLAIFLHHKCLLTKIRFYFDVSRCCFPIFELWISHSYFVGPIRFLSGFSVEVVNKMHNSYDMPGKNVIYWYNGLLPYLNY